MKHHLVARPIKPPQTERPCPSFTTGGHAPHNPHSSALCTSGTSRLVSVRTTDCAHSRSFPHTRRYTRSARWYAALALGSPASAKSSPILPSITASSWLGRVMILRQTFKAIIVAAAAPRWFPLLWCISLINVTVENDKWCTVEKLEHDACTHLMRDSVSAGSPESII